jgi:putative hemolysin
MRNYQTEAAGADVSGLLSRNLLGTGSPSAENLVWEKILFLDRLRDLYQKVTRPDGGPILENLLKELQITYEVDDEDLTGIPETGPAIVVANHPFGMLEGAIVGTMLPRIRPDVKIMTNYLLAGLPEIENQCIFVDPFKSKSASTINQRALRQALRWLKSGGMLVMFPAGEVSHWRLPSGEITDPEWSDTASRLVRMTGSCVVPVFFKGTNSIPFHLLGIFHPRLRTVSLPLELLNKMGKNVEVRVGTTIPHKTIVEISDHRDAISYLRWRTYLLGRRGECDQRLVPRVIRAVVPKKTPEPIAIETPRDELIDDIRNLGEEQCVQDTGEYSVYLAGAEQMPNVLRELGRLREIAFRAAGEGTGKDLDLDCFDSYYLHLFLWNKVRRELVGAYRIGGVHEILALFGPRGLYTSSLFHYEPEFFQRIGPALELGRSFIRPEYQRLFPPLLLLWRGLATYVARNPEAPVLFGAVSVSNEYNPASRRLLAHFLELHRRDDSLAPLVRPRRQFRPARDSELDGQVMNNLLPDLDSISVPISDIETDGKRVPILLKQYLKLGGNLLGFNVDPSFSETLDGLVLVDLRQTEASMLRRYMGPEKATRFLEYHGMCLTDLSARAANAHVELARGRQSS